MGWDAQEEEGVSFESWPTVALVRTPLEKGARWEAGRGAQRVSGSAVWREGASLEGEARDSGQTGQPEEGIRP